jgi:TolB-like protein/Tfp pilus assembly protein PilF
MERRLAAILAADVVGYSRLMERDETGTVAALKEARRAILSPLVARYFGRIIKVMGDGVLVEFASAVNAVGCAVELQKKMTEAAAGEPDDRRIVLRIGINLGDVIVEGDDLYGDGVIIATRIQALAEPGDTWIAASVYDQIEKKLALDFEDLGLREIKNIARPVHVYRIVPDQAPAQTTSGTGAPAKPSIAVLPFTNMSGDPEQHYFSDGITEDIITELSRFHDLFVIARNSSFQYQGKAIDVKRVGRELGVHYVVEGSVRRVGGRIRIVAQLVDAGSGNHLWAERYDREMQDIFAVQEDVAQSVAATVSGRVEAAGLHRALRLNPSALKAYDLVLRSKALLLRYNRTDNEQSRILLEKAVELDPTSARAHSLLAWCHLYDNMFWWTADRERALGKAYEAAQRAVVLDDSDSFTRLRLGQLHLFRREYDEARSEIEKAINLNPNDSEARGVYGIFLICIGEPDIALEQLDLAKRHDPFDISWAPWTRGMAHFTAHRYEEAIAELRQAREPINEVRGWLAASYAHAGLLVEARATLEEFLRVAERDMAVFPGRRLKDWEAYWHGAMEFRDQKEFDHLFAALRKAGLPD